MRTQRHGGRVFSGAIMVGLLLLVGIGGILQAGQNLLTANAQSVGAGCSSESVKQLAKVVNLSWKMAGPVAQKSLVALNTAAIPCYAGGSKSFERCDVNALSNGQLNIALARTKKQKLTTDTVNGYSDALSKCLDVALPATATESATEPATPPPTEQATQQVSGQAVAAQPTETLTAAASSGGVGPRIRATATSRPSPTPTPDCESLFAEWSLQGNPDQLTAADLSAFFAAILKCYSPSTVRLCSIPALSQLQLGMRAAVIPNASAFFQSNESLILSCFGYNPLLLQGFVGVIAGSGGGGGGGGNGGGNGGGTGSGTGSGDEQTPEVGTIGGPYIVKQTQSLGGESISGFVCSLSAPFTVSVHAPTIGFTFNFTPADETHGAITYAYSIAKAGETHNASGSYTVTPPDPDDGSRVVSFSVADKVAFKGFAGTFANKYSFELDPSRSVSCPSS